MSRKILIIVNHPRNILLYRLDLISALKQHGYTVITCAAYDQQVVEKIRNNNIEFIPVRMQAGGISPIKDIIALMDLFKIIKRESPDIVINYTIKPNIYGSIAAHFAGVKNIYSMVTGLGYVFIGRGIKRGLLRFFAKILYRTSSRYNKKIFFQNGDDISLFTGCNIIEKKKTVLINGSGVNIQKFSQVDLPNDCKFLLITRLLKDKGVIEYVRAAKIIKQKYPHIEFKLVGDFGEEKNPAAIKQDVVDEWKREGVVDFFGTVDDVRSMICSSSVCVLPSYREGTPKAILEAMAMGRPIITTDVPGCRQTIQNGKNGYLVPARDATKLALAMEKFILQPDLMKSMGAVSRKIAEEKYDVHKVNSVILDVLEGNNEQK